jgi:hypothetical protein
MDCKVVGIVQEINLADMKTTHLLRMRIPQTQYQFLLEADEETVQRIINAAVLSTMREDRGAVSAPSSDEGEGYGYDELPADSPMEQEPVGQYSSANSGARLFAKTVEVGGADVFGGDFTVDLDHAVDAAEAPDNGHSERLAVNSAQVDDVPRNSPVIPPLPTIQTTSRIKDRSGVPSRELPGHLVDAKGNPIVRGGGKAPIFYDEDEGIGEQI